MGSPVPSSASTMQVSPGLPENTGVSSDSGTSAVKPGEIEQIWSPTKEKSQVNNPQSHAKNPACEAFGFPFPISNGPTPQQPFYTIGNQFAPSTMPQFIPQGLVASPYYAYHGSFALLPVFVPHASNFYPFGAPGTLINPFPGTDIAINPVPGGELSGAGPADQVSCGMRQQDPGSPRSASPDMSESLVNFVLSNLNSATSQDKAPCHDEVPPALVEESPESISEENSASVLGENAASERQKAPTPVPAEKPASICVDASPTVSTASVLEENASVCEDTPGTVDEDKLASICEEPSASVHDEAPLIVLDVAAASAAAEACSSSVTPATLEPIPYADTSEKIGTTLEGSIVVATFPGPCHFSVQNINEDTPVVYEETSFNQEHITSEASYIEEDDASKEPVPAEILKPEDPQKSKFTTTAEFGEKARGSGNHATNVAKSKKQIPKNPHCCKNADEGNKENFPSKLIRVSDELAKEVTSNVVFTEEDYKLQRSKDGARASRRKGKSKKRGRKSKLRKSDDRSKMDHSYAMEAVEPPKPPTPKKKRGRPFRNAKAEEAEKIKDLPKRMCLRSATSSAHRQKDKKRARDSDSESASRSGETDDEKEVEITSRTRRTRRRRL